MNLQVHPGRKPSSFSNGASPPPKQPGSCRSTLERQSTSHWRKEWLTGGNDDLRSSPAQREELTTLIEAGAIAAGMVTEVWTLARLARLIRTRYGVEYHPGHTWPHVASARLHGVQLPATHPSRHRAR